MERIAGMWWLPESPTETVPGHLEREGDQFVLHLVGSLVGWEGPDGVIPVILGKNGDEPVSLLDAVWRGSGGPSSGAATHESWQGLTVLRGAAVEGWDAPAFDVAEVELDDLAHFMNLRLVEIERRLPDDDVREVAVIRRPPMIAAKTSDSEYGLLSTWSTTLGMRDVNYRYRASLNVRLGAVASLSDVDYRHVRPMRYLLALATARDIGTTAMRLGQVDPDVPFSRVPQWEVLNLEHDRADAHQETIPQHMLFTCEDWDFASGFPRWKEVVNVYGPTCDLIFSRAARDNRYLSTRFLNTVTAAESFHRRWSPRGTKASADHKLRVANLIKVAPEEDRTWLQSKLSFSHEPSLANRLEELVGLATPAARPYVGSAKPWARAVTDARNALVHRPPKRDDPEDDPEGLLVLEHSVAAVVTICLLRELGFDANDCGQRLSRIPNWNWVPKDMQTRHAALFLEPDEVRS